MQETYITREEVERIVAEKVKEAMEEFVRKGEEKMLERRLNFTQWIMIVGFTLLGTLTTVANFLR